MMADWTRRCDSSHCIETYDDGTGMVVIRESGDTTAWLAVPKASWEAFLAGVRAPLEAEIERLKARMAWLQIYRQTPRGGRCRTCGGAESKHAMYCAHYVGALEHRWSRWSSWNGTFGGVEHHCICGGWFRQGGMAGHGDGSESAEAVCPNAAESWRGPQEVEEVRRG